MVDRQYELLRKERTKGNEDGNKPRSSEDTMSSTAEPVPAAVNATSEDGHSNQEVSSTQITTSSWIN